MTQLLSRLLISGVAVAVILARIFRPDIKVDETTLALIAVALSPWLSSVIKGVEVPGVGVKLEYRDSESRPSASASPDPNNDRAPARVNLGTGSSVWRTSERKPDSYLERLAKLTPVESIALYVVVWSVLQSTPTHAGVVLEWIIFGLFIVFTPLFLSRIGVCKRSQLIVSTFLFCVWIFAIGGPFAGFHWYRPWYGGILLALFVSVLPLVQFQYSSR